MSISIANSLPLISVTNKVFRIHIRFISINRGFDSNCNVEGVWVFHRHGDRTPSISLCPDYAFNNEVKFWKRKLPSDDFMKNMNQKFPASIDTSNEGYYDAAHEPFGYLTQLGCNQMKSKGSKLASRYNIKHSLTQEIWDFDAYSTNYLRTVTSAQCFLDGLFNSEPINLKVKVRDPKHDPLNAFDRNPQLMKELVSGVRSNLSFQEKDSLAVPLATRLARFLPGLVSKKR